MKKKIILMITLLIPIRIEATSIETDIDFNNIEQVTVFEKIDNLPKDSTNLYVEINNKVAEIERKYQTGEISKEQMESDLYNKIYTRLDSDEEMKKIIDSENIYNRSSSIIQNSDSLYAHLTAKEIQICSVNYSKCQKVKKLKEHTEYYTAKYYKQYSRKDGNGDAFRHAYWSGLMAKNLGKGFAYDIGLAHENLSRGYDINSLDDDVRMDVSNNGFGRLRGDDLKNKPDSVLRNNIVNHVSKGNLKRVRVGTNGRWVGYYAKTSSGGRK